MARQAIMAYTYMNLKLKEVHIGMAYNYVFYRFETQH